MARLISKTTGNFTASTSWGVCDTTSAWVIDSEAGTLSITTSTSTHISPNATPGAITVDGVALKISSRAASPTGTFTVVLRNTTAGSDVTSVVVNVSDLPINGWVFFKFGSSQSLSAATNYAIRVTCSVSGGVVLMRSTASAQEFSRLIRTTTEAAPAAGDQMIVSKQFTGAGASTAVTITMDNTASTIFGSASYTESVEVSGGGVLTWGTSASTNYLLTVAGNVHIHDTGTWNMGTSGTRIPATSTAVLAFSVGTNVDSGFVAQPGSIVNCYGNIVTADSTLMTVSRGGYCTTSGTAVTGVAGQSFVGLTGTIVINSVSYTISSVTDSTHLTLTGSAGTQSTPVAWTHAGTAATLTVASTSGWSANDSLAIASTSRTNTDCENIAISTVDSATQVTLASALTKNHSGDSPTQAEVINLTRNVKIRGSSTSLQAYVYIQTTSTVNLSYVEFYWLGSATTNKLGVDITTNTGACTIVGCTFHDFVVTGSYGINVSAADFNNISITYSHTYNTATAACVVGTTLSSSPYTSWTVSNCVFMRNIAIGTAVTFSAIGGTISNITVIGSGYGGMSVGAAYSIGTITVGTISGITVHSCQYTGFFLAYSAPEITISNLNIWRNLNGGIGLTYGGFTFDGGNVFGNGNANLYFHQCDGIIKNMTFNGDVAFSTTNGINQINAANCGTIVIESCNFGTVSGIKTAHTGADIQCNLFGGGSIYKIICRNTILASSTEVGSQTILSPNSFITSQKHDQTAGLHKRWEKTGTAVIDTTTYRTASPAETLTPLWGNAAYKFKSSPTQPVAVDAGQTITPTVYVYKSAAYNGNQPRLIVKANPAVGITSDTVLATASGGTGSWLTLTGTTAAATDDGALVFYVDCDGTAGTVTVDDWSVA